MRFHITLNGLQATRRNIALGVGVFGNQNAICRQNELTLGMG